MSTKTFWDFMYNSDKKIEESEKKMALDDIVSDEELTRVYYYNYNAYTNLKGLSPRDFLNNGVAKKCNGWWNGYTLEKIIEDLGLSIENNEGELVPSEKGLAYYNLLTEDLKIKFKK
jgi:hypothetical protein